jgi:VWFA-related protein
MEHSMNTAQEAAIGFVRELREHDVTSIVDFDSRVQITQDFTNDVDALEAAIRRTRAGGSTSMYNALYIALKQLAKLTSIENRDAPRRRAVILLSDGADTSSLVSFDDILNIAASADTIVYAIGLVTPTADAAEKDREGSFVLRRLAQQTGGRAYFPRNAQELAAIYGDIRQELAGQYLLAYTSTGT